MFQKKQTNECPSKFSDPAQNAVKHLKSMACFHFLADFLVPWFHLRTRGGESLVWLCSAGGGTRTGQNWEDDGMMENLITIGFPTAAAYSLSPQKSWDVTGMLL